MVSRKIFIAFALVALLVPAAVVAQDDDVEELPRVDADLAGDRVASKTDDQVVQREEEAISIDGLSVAEVKRLREQSEKFAFQAEVNRMMKMIINSLYKNKEIFLRELISNASDALDKIRFLALTNKEKYGDDLGELSIRIQADKKNKVLHITDTGVGMTHSDLVKNLGTIAKSGTSEFLQAVQEGAADTSNLIGQFGVGFYSAFLVADTVMVTTKHVEDKQYIWESNAEAFSIVEDPRGNTLGRGTTVSLFLKDEAQDFLEQETLRNLIRKYSEFINFPIYLYTSKTEQVEEEVSKPAEEKKEEAVDEDGKVEEDVEEEKKESRKVDKTTYDWQLMNENKPIWTRNAKDVEEDEYNRFFKGFTKETKDPLAHIHFTAEGEVAFRSILFVPQEARSNLLMDYYKTTTSIKMYVRRVFITDEFEEMLPKYLNFVSGIVDSDDLPLNVSRETLQQHKLLKVIRKKLVRKALEMIKKIADKEDKKDYETFWKNFGTNIKLGIIDDFSNRTRLAKLLRFASSNSATENTSLDDYVKRMKEGQAGIYFMAGMSREDVEKSPFVERLLKRGYEVLYLTDPVDEYTLQNLPEFDGKKFQNVAKEGLKFGDETESEKKRVEKAEKAFKPLTDWLKANMIDHIEKAVVSNRLEESPCALVASSYGWSGNMERIMRAQAYAASNDPSQQFYQTQKKILEINPRHPLVKELLKRVESEPNDATTLDLAKVLYETAVLRSGFALKDSADFAARIERMLRLSLDVDPDAPIEEEPEEVEEEAEEAEEAGEEGEEEAAEDAPEDGEAQEPTHDENEHDEL